MPEIEIYGDEEERIVTEWTQTDTQASPTAPTATRAAGAAGVRHFVTSITAGYSAAGIGLLTISDGATVIWQTYINNSFSLTFAKPLGGRAATALTITLAAAPVGASGAFTATGYSV